MVLEIITPEQNVFQGEVDAVFLPGKVGRFELLKDHAPMVSTLKDGALVYAIGNKKESIEIGGGVLQVINNKVLGFAETVP